MTVLEQEQTVPERLAQPLQIVAGRARMLAWLRAIFQLLALAAGVWLTGTLLMGSTFRLPLWVGIPLAILIWGTLAVGAFFILRHLFRFTSDLTTAARLADSAMPDSQERISSAVEISQEQDPTFRGSPELVAVLMRQAEHHADTMDPGIVISGHEVMRWLTAAATLFVIWLLLLVILTPNMLLGMQRMIQPWTASAPLPQMVVQVDPGDVVKAQGADVKISVTVKPPEGVSLDRGNQPLDKATIRQHFISGTDSPEVKTAMRQTGPRTFEFNIENLRQSFTYQITAEGGKELGTGTSQEFTVSVQTRPAVADMELTYAYPAYTGLNPRTEHSRDGLIEALVGTKVRVTVHATEAVKTASLLLADAGFGPKTIELTRVANAPEAGSLETSYTGEFTILKSSEYKVRLVKDDGRDNPDAQLRPIHARPDNPPTIAILQPESTAAALKVRPDDTIPMKFSAADDYGISSVEALVQIDDRPATRIPVPIDPRQTQLNSDWELKLADLLKNLPPNAAPKRIAYQFRATDNRDPEPQSALSGRQLLDLDAATTPLAQRMDTQAARDLAGAIKSAQSKLNQAQSNLSDLQKSDTAARPTDADRKKLDETQQALTDAASQLRQAADQADKTRLNAIGTQVRQIAENPVKNANEETTKARLATDQAAPRRSSQATALRNTQTAIDQLNKLSDTIQKTAMDQPLAQALERMAQEQRKIAEDLAKNPNDPAALAAQEKLRRELDAIIKENPQLQKPAEQAQQPRVDELVKKVQQIEQDQQQVNDQLNKANAAQNITEKAAEIAKKQTALNQSIKDFNQTHADAMKAAGARPPDPARLDPPVKELQENKLAAASRDQKAIATSLDQAAERLNSAQQKANDTSAAKQAAQQQAQQDAQTAAEMQKQTQQLAQDIEKAKASPDPPGRPTHPVNQQASKLADQMRQAAQQIAQHSPPGSAARTAAQNAINQADAAKRSTSQLQADPAKAQQQLAQAADQIAQAAAAEQNAANNNPLQGSQGKAAEIAAQQAKSLSEQQNQLADQSAQLAKGQEDAANAKANAAATADRQRELADQMNQAARDAQALQQQNQGAAPALADKAGQAAQAMQQAADAQRQASQSTRTADPAATAQQAQASQKMADAEQALTGRRPAPAPSPQQASAPPANQLPNNNGSPTPGDITPEAVQSARNALTQAAKGNPQAAQKAAEQLAQAAQQLMNNNPGGTPQAAPAPGQGQGQIPGPNLGAPAASGAGNSNSPVAPENAVAELPKEIQDIGISPSDWVKLSPQAQNDLLHAAQQPGPPGYQDMIKNYKTRISRMQQNGAAK